MCHYCFSTLGISVGSILAREQAKGKESCGVREQGEADNNKYSKFYGMFEGDKCC